MQDEITHIGITQIKPGTDIDSRGGNTEAAADKRLVQSIRDYGLISPIVVRTAGKGMYTVVAGHRRLAACKELDYKTMPCHVINVGDEIAASLSYEENDVRLPVHPIDRAKALAHIAKMSDRSLKEVAKGFGLNARQMQQAEAISKLAPLVLKEWRDGKLDYETATAFAIEPDQDKQTATLKLLLKDKWRINRPTIHKALLAEGATAVQEHLLNVATRKAYIEAGGTITEDLFGNEVIVSDYQLLFDLAEKAIEKKTIEACKIEGFAGVIPVDEHVWSKYEEYEGEEDYASEVSWKDLLKLVPKEQRSEVWVQPQVFADRIEYTPYTLKPEQTPYPDDDDYDDDDTEEALEVYEEHAKEITFNRKLASIPHRAADSCRVWTNEALRQALLHDDLAMERLFILYPLAYVWRFGHIVGYPTSEGWPDIDKVEAMNEQQRQRYIWHILANTIETGRMSFPEQMSVVRLCGPAHVRNRMLELIDYKEYAQAFVKDDLLKMVRELGGEPSHTAKKVELIQQFADIAKAHDWLPDHMEIFVKQEEEELA